MWLVGVVRKRQVWLVGESMGVVRIGVVSGCCSKEVYRYPHNNYYFFHTLLVLALFGAAASLLLCSFKKCIFVLVY